MSRSDPAFDAAVVGGGPAGLSAALVLGRAGRRTVLFDDHQPRNAPAAHAHGFLTRDGAPPEELRRLGRAEVEHVGVTLRDARVEGAARTDDGFRLVAGEEAVTARVLILATGVVDELPAIEGLAEAWGETVVHCPYCHGGAHRGAPTAVLGRGDGTFLEARLLLGWTDDLVVVTNGPEDLNEGQEGDLAEAGIAIVRTPIARLRVDGRRLEAIEFADGTVLPRRVLYLRPPQRQRSDLAERLGATLDEDGLVAVDEKGRTGVPGLFAVGDAANAVQDIATAVSGGVRAAMAANYDLVVGPIKA